MNCSRAVRRRWGSAAALLCLWVSMLSLPLAAQTYEVSGVVLQSLTNAPLSRVTLSLASTSDRGTSLFAAITDGEGKFRLAGIPAGKYSLTAQRNGFRAQALDQHGSRSTAVVVGPNSNSLNIVFCMHPRTALTVMVVDEENQPVRQANVTLFGKRIRDGEFTLAQAGGGSTNDTGRITFSTLDSGTYYAVVNAQPWYAQRLMPRYRQTVVEDPPRGPLEVAYPLTWSGGGADLTTASPITLETGMQSTVTVAMQPVPAVRVRIPMPPDYEGQRGVLVRVSAELPYGRSLFINPQQQHEPDGILLMGLAPGRYVFDVQEPPMNQSVKSMPRTEKSTENSHLMVTADVAGDMTLTLAPPPQVVVTGRISSDLALPGKGANFQLISEASAPERSDVTIPLDQNLSFKSADGTLRPGRYRVTTSFPMTQVNSVALNGQPAKPGNMVTLPAGNVSLVVNVGQRRVAQVEGVVTDQEKPRSGIAIYLLSQDAKNPSKARYQEQSDSDGSFSLEVDAGKYIGVAIENGFELEYGKPEVMEPYLAAGTPIDAAAGKRTQVNLKVQPRQ